MRFHRPELDVLRFGAFFLVFTHHALPHSSADYPALAGPLAQLFAATGRAGAWGVDLFFALSAYLITELLLREQRRTGSLDLRAFYARRVLRIWPLYFFALLILAPLSGMPWSYIAGFALLAGNWVCAFAGFPPSPFALLWSVSIEEQFYLAWPLLLKHRLTAIRRWLAAMLLAATATRLVLAISETPHPGVWCNPLARLDPIACGAWLAFHLNGSVPQLSTPRRAAQLAGGLAGFLVCGAFGDHAGWGALWTYPLSALSALALLHGALGLGGNAVLGYFGKISFGLYVFHAAALELVEQPLPALALTIAAGSLSYRFLETPFLRCKDRFAR